MEYTYSLTTSYDGELVNTLRVSDMLEARCILKLSIATERS